LFSRRQRSSTARPIGSGVVSGIGDDDPSAIGTYAQIGAAFGLALVWAPIAALPIIVAVQVAVSRLGVVHGIGLVGVAKRQLPRWLVVAVFVPVLLASVFTLGADLRAMANATGLIVPLPDGFLLACLTLISFGLPIFLPYRRYRTVLRWFALGIVAYLGVVLVADVDWASVLDNVLRPHVPWDRSGVGALIAVVGAAVSPYIIVWQANAEVEESRLTPGAPPPGAEWHRRAAVDVVAGLTTAIVAAVAIVIASATALHTAGITKVQTADDAARALEPLLGRAAGAAFAIGLLGVGLLAAPILAGGAAFIGSELFGLRAGLGRRLKDAPGFYALLVAAAVAALSLEVFGVPPVRALYYASIANGVAAPGLLLLVLWLARSRRVLGAARIGRTGAALIALGALAGVALPVAYFMLPT
jgi:Mn2+/Fe2+ NRAMP family transporter